MNGKKKKNLIRALRTIRGYCRQQKNCEACPLGEHGCVKCPEDWEFAGMFAPVLNVSPLEKDPRLMTHEEESFGLEEMIFG